MSAAGVLRGSISGVSDTIGWLGEALARVGAGVKLPSCFPVKITSPHTAKCPLGDTLLPD